jgi:uncharacterized integral membrane protein (TIGR00698 family)
MLSGTVPVTLRRSDMKFVTWLKEKVPGIVFCAVIAVPSYFLGKLVPVVGGPVFAILFGMCIALVLKKNEMLKGGIAFTSKKILQYAVILLGFGMNISAILAKGRQSLPVIVVTITVSLVTSFVLTKAMHIPSKVGTLVGIGSSICGGSAIAAAAPVIDADDEEIAQSISVIFLFNIIAALIFPALGSLLGLSNEGFGLFAGTAVNDTSSVTATASAWDGIHGSSTLQDATIVKLTRTLAIIPITFALALIRLHREKKEAAGAKSSFSFIKIFPWFVVWFVCASLVTTFFNLSASVTDPLKWLSKFFIIMAMAAIGLNTNIVKLVKTGGKPILLGFICWICIAAASLLMQHALHIL